MVRKRNWVYLDSPELAKRYGGKPEKLKNIRERAATKYCRMRGNLLYNILEYQNDEDKSASSVPLDAAHLTN